MSAFKVVIGSEVPFRLLTGQTLYGRVVAINGNKVRVSCHTLNLSEWVELESLRRMILLDRMRKRNGSER